MGGTLSRQRKAALGLAVPHYLGAVIWLFEPAPLGPSTSTDMGSCWSLFLLLLFGNGALNLPGTAIVWGVPSQAPPVSKGTISCPSTSSALSNNGNDHIPAAESNSSPTTRTNSISESQEHTISLILPVTPQTSNSMGSTQQTPPIHGTWERKLDTPITTTTKDAPLSNSMMTSTLKDQGTRTTILPSMATSAENPKQNQITLVTASAASNPTARGMESSVFPNSENIATIKTPPALNSQGNDIGPSRSMTTTVSEKSTLTTSSTTLDKVLHSHEHLPITTRDSIHTASLMTATTLGTTVLGTTVPGSQEGETVVAPLTPTTTSTKSNPSDTHHNTDTQTSSHPAQPTSGVGTTPATDPSTSNPTASGMEFSVSPGSENTAEITVPPAFNTPGSDTDPFRSMTTTVSEKSTLTTSSTTLDKVLHSHEHLPITTRDFSYIDSLTTTTLGTTVLGTTVPGTQEGETTAAPLTPTTTSIKSNPSDTHRNTDTQTPSHPAQPTSGVGTTPSTDPSTSNPTASGMEFSVSHGSENTAEITVPPAFNTPGSDIDPFRSMTTTVSEKSTLTTSSTTLDKVLHSHEHLPITTRDFSYIDSLTTTTLGTTVLGITVPGTQEGETTAALLTPTTTSMKSNPSDTHHNTDTQTPSHPAQSTSGVGTTPPTVPQASNSIAGGMESSVTPGSEIAATILAPLVLNTPGKDIGSSMYMTTAVSEKSTLTTSSTTLDKVLHSHEHLPTTTITTSDSSHIASLTTTTLGTTVLEKTVPETQEDKTITVFTTPTKSNPSGTNHNTVTQTPSHLVQSASDVGADIAQSPETTVYSTALVLSNSGTTKSSAVTWAPKYSQNSSPGAGACALDEYPVSIGVCKCNDSYYAHSELSRELVTLHCWQQNIEVALSLCFLETHHWILREGAFSGCSSISKVEQGRRVQAFKLKKKEGTCGLRLSTNISHALYSLEVGLVQVLPGFNNTVSTKFGFSCAYPLVVNVSQMLPNLVDPSPTIHIPSTGDTIVIMSIFTDPQLSTPLKNRTVPLGMTLYVVLKATNSDPDRFALVVNEVFASTNISKTGAVKATHHFVNKSCPVGSQLLDGLPDNGASLQVTLVFKLFRFLKSDTLYLHARVTLCDKQAGRSCQPPCSLKNSLRRSSPWKTRSREGLERGGRWIVFGPLRISESKASSSRSSAETTSSEEEQEPGFLPLSGSFGPGGPCGTSPMDGRALRRSSRGSFTRGSLEDLLSVDPEAYQSSVWLGTEDGCVHVYQSSDSIRDRRNSMKLQHTASVTCILYLNNQVFVSLANGELVVYQREAGRFWDPQNFKSVTLGAQGSPITKMVSVGGRLWCGCQNRVLVLSPDTLQQEHTFHVGQDSSRSVACMVDSSLGVWVTLKGSAHVCLYHADTFEQLAEVDVTPPVHRMLAGSDAIIRQHKAACLRITALLVCEELLWVGTSAGVVLTMPTSPSTVSCPRAPLSPTGLGQGHTGHVRFLAAVQLPDGFNLICPTPPPPPDTGPEKLPSLEYRGSPRHRGPASAKPKMLVISGGDGYEDFRLSSGGGGSSETVGRDDSTNHLLLWRV